MINQDKYMSGIEKAIFHSELPFAITLRKKWQKTPGKSKKEVKGECLTCFFLRISDTLLVVLAVPPPRASHQYLNKRGVL
jgi:hypothetical protein